MAIETRAAQHTLLAVHELQRQEAILKETYDPADRKSQLHQVALAAQAVADARLRELVVAKQGRVPGIRNPTLEAHIELLKGNEKSASAQASLAWKNAEAPLVVPETDFTSQIGRVVLVMISHLFFP